MLVPEAPPKARRCPSPPAATHGRTAPSGGSAVPRAPLSGVATPSFQGPPRTPCAGSAPYAPPHGPRGPPCPALTRPAGAVVSLPQHGLPPQHPGSSPEGGLRSQTLENATSPPSPPRTIMLTDGRHEAPVFHFLKKVASQVTCDLTEEQMEAWRASVTFPRSPPMVGRARRNQSLGHPASALPRTPRGPVRSGFLGHTQGVLGTCRFSHLCAPRVYAQSLPISCPCPLPTTPHLARRGVSVTVS